VRASGKNINITANCRIFICKNDHKNQKTKIAIIILYNQYNMPVGSPGSFVFSPLFNHNNIIKSEKTIRLT